MRIVLSQCVAFKSVASKCLEQKVSVLKQVACYLCRNADISNTYKLDLHALHIEQALEQIEKTINDLSSFKCKGLTCPAMLCNTNMQLKTLMSLNELLIFL